MANLEPKCRLHAILAEDCRRAIIFRCGPSKTVRLIAWDRETDTFEPGQWMRRARVYAERSHISPDGAFLLIFIGTFRPPFRTYTVLSRPPFFTALALWPKGDTWGGGGTFIGPREIVLQHTDCQAKLAPGFERPANFMVHPMGPEANVRLASYWKNRSGWHQREQNARRSFVKRSSGDVLLVATPPGFGCARFTIETQRRTLTLPGAEWADVDANGDIIFSSGGTLQRLRREEVAKAAAHDDLAPHVQRLADFSDMRFESIAAPYATGCVLDETSDSREPASFAPRLDRVSKEDRRRRIRARKAEKRLRTSGET